MNYYEHWLGDYAKKTSRLRMIDHGAYRLLLDEYYANESPLPQAFDELFTICGAVSTAERESVRKVANAFFPVGPDGLRHNERADQEIAKAQPRIKAARENGKKNRKTPPNGNPPGNPLGMPTGNPPATHAGEAFPHTPYPNTSGAGLSESHTTGAGPPKSAAATFAHRQQARLSVAAAIYPQGVDDEPETTEHDITSEARRIG